MHGARIKDLYLHLSKKKPIKNAPIRLPAPYKHYYNSSD